jgi:hypothetical protein
MPRADEENWKISFRHRRWSKQHQRWMEWVETSETYSTRKYAEEQLWLIRAWAKKVELRRHMEFRDLKLMRRSGPGGEWREVSWR